MPNKPPSIIAIDGPAASGKSTLGRRLAEALGYLFFDTGVMYRAVTWQALEDGVNVSDESAVTALARAIDIDVRRPAVRRAPVRRAGQRRNVTWEIRSEAVDANVSIVAAYPGVRLAMGEQQRQIGRAVAWSWSGATSAPSSCPRPLKIYLDASATERARRRYEELRAAECSRPERCALHRAGARPHRLHPGRGPAERGADAVLIDFQIS